MISSVRLSDILVEVADTLVDEFDLVDFLHTVASRAAEVTESSAVGIMLADHESVLRHMASSSEDGRLLEVFQLQHAEGPCLECFTTGEEVSDVTVGDELERWPVFAPRALALGFTRTHCFPLRLREQVIGAMNVFRSGSDALDHEERRVLRAMADVATISLMQERAIRRAEELTEQLQFALNSRIVIEQAKGAVARTFDVDVDRAFVILRDHARRHRERLTEVARRVVEDPTAMADLSAD